MTYAVGVWVRARYGLQGHNPRHHVVSDAADMMVTSEHMMRAGAVQTLYDTIWPPGTPATMAALRAVDATLSLGVYCQVLLSCVLPLVVAHTASLVAGRRVGWVALAFASLHLGYIHYVGFFLSEALFQAACTLAFWLTMLAVVAANRDIGKGRLLLMGLPVGASWTLAALYRPNATPVAACMGVVAVCYALWQRKSRGMLWLFTGAALAGAMLLIPAAHRCSTIKGRVCLVSSNLAMNVALGQAGPVRTLHFVDPATNGGSTWSPPSLWLLRYEGAATVPAEIYDTPGVLAWVAERWRAAPGAALVRAVGNSLDVFRIDYWPPGFAFISKRGAAVAAQLFMLFVVFPGLLGGARALRAMRQRRAPLPVVILVASMLGVVVLAFLSQGEPRYRFPFDVAWIVLAAAVWTRTDVSAPTHPPVASDRVAGWALAAGGSVATAVVLLVSSISHPALALGQHLQADDDVVPGRVRKISAEAVETPRVDGHPWHLGTQQIVCAPRCEELRVTWPVPQRGRSIQISLDHNDAYRIVFYRKGRRLDAHDVDFQRAGNGLRVHTVGLPEHAEEFDALGVVPLWGDGLYSLGHVAVR